MLTRRLLSSMCAFLGVGLLIASFAWPAFDDGESAWTDEQATRYSEVTEKMHIVAAVPDAVKEDPAEFKAEFQQLTTELQWAQNRSTRISRWLGVGAIVQVGAAWWLGRKATTSAAQ